MIPTNVPPVHLSRAEQLMTRYFHRAVAGTTIDHVMDPDYWVHVAARLQRTPNKGIGDEIRVVADDGSFDVDVTIVAIDPRGLWVQVRPLRVWEGQKAEIAATANQWPDEDGYTVEFGGAHKWRIIDRANNVVAKGFADKGMALDALVNIKAAKKAA